MSKANVIPIRDFKSETGYRFVDKDPDLELVTAYIREDFAGNPHQFARATCEFSFKGLSPSTIKRWLDGNTKKPQNFTLTVAMATLGLERRVYRRGRRVA